MISKKLKYFSFFAALIMVLSCGGDKESDQIQAPPAQIQNAEKEADLTKITLSPEAELRLGIQTTPVEYRHVERILTYGGEVEAVSGRSIVVSAPLPGNT